MFSLVRIIKTKFRSNLHTETVSSLIGIHLLSTFNCCEQSSFETSLLQKAKFCTKDNIIIWFGYLPAGSNCSIFQFFFPFVSLLGIFFSTEMIMKLLKDEPWATA